MAQLPREFAELLSPSAQRILSGDRSRIPVDLSDEKEKFFILEDAFSPEASALCMDIFDRDFYPDMGHIAAPIRPEWIWGMTKNYADSYGKTMRVRSRILQDENDPIYQRAVDCGLIGMLRSDSLRKLAEIVTGFKLEGSYGTQISCNELGDYVGPHNDHHPEFAWARHGYVDVQFMIANDAVDHQWFVHEREGHLTQMWSLKQRGGISFFRQPFWHYTTPLVPVSGREKEARRWLVGQVFRIHGMLEGRTPRGSAAFVRWLVPESAPAVEEAAVPARSESEFEALSDDARPLSQSALWTWQRDFYAERGIGAWSEGTVPVQITNNPLVARNYADVVEGLVKDLAQQGKLERSQPMNLLELGAGSGRLGYLVLKELAKRKSPALEGVRFRYVMTDFSRATRDGWRAIPELARLCDEGRLVFAGFDAAEPKKLVWDEEEQAVDLGQSPHPVVVLANYWFDSIPHDYFKAKAGTLEACHVRVTASRHLLRRELDGVDVEVVCEPAAPHYYGHAAFDALLSGYARALPEDTTFLFPIAPLRCLEGLRSLVGDKLLVLASDKGHVRRADLEGAAPLHVSVHGSFSLMVNFDAIAEYARAQGGGACLGPQQSTPVALTAFYFGLGEGELPHTLAAFSRAAESHHPHDVHLLLEGLTHEAHISLPLALAMLRNSHYDPWVFGRLAQALRVLVRGADRALLEELSQVIDRVWAHHLPIGEKADLAFEMGALLQIMRKSEKAARFYQHSLSRKPRASVLYNLGLCQYEGDQFEQAEASFREALGFDPAHAHARSWLHEAEQARLSTSTHAAAC